MRGTRLNTDVREIEPDSETLESRLAPDDDDGRDPLERIAEEFLDRVRRGERPSVSEFLARAPDRAGELDELLSALLLVEDVKPQFEPLTASGALEFPGGGPDLERLGDFRILRELGRGGMGIVYEAEQESLGRHVALKVLAPGVARSPQIVRRFIREARAAAQLHHTNIVPVFGVGERGGLHYFAMQFILGSSLDKVLKEVVRLKRMATSGSAGPASATRTNAPDTSIAQSLAAGDFARPPGPGRAEGDAEGYASLAAATEWDGRYTSCVAGIGRQVAEALEYAHQQGTLHRDIKPSNLLLDIHGVAWVTDFGLAKAVEDEDLTRPGDVVGTIRYMAPERFRGRCDAQSDVYGLGLTLYELLAFRPAFEASDRERLVYQVNEVEPPRLRRLNPDVPADLETIVHKAIEKDAAHRYARAAELAEDLRCFLEDRPIGARRVSSTERLTRWARRNPGLASLGTALAGMLALVVVVIVLSDLRLRREHEASVTSFQRAKLAEGEALGKLRDSYVANARASRRSRFAGRRFDGLQAIRAAAALDEPGDRRLELRNEAIACLALPDLRPGRSWEDGSHGIYSGVDFDPTTGRMACGTLAGDVLVREAGGGDALVLYSKAGVCAALVRFSPDGRYLAVKHEECGEVTLKVVWDVARAEKVLRNPRRHAARRRPSISTPTGARWRRGGATARSSCTTWPEGVRFVACRPGRNRTRFASTPPAPGSPSSAIRPARGSRCGVLMTAPSRPPGSCPNPTSPWNGTRTAAGWRLVRSTAGSAYSTRVTRRGRPGRSRPTMTELSRWRSRREDSSWPARVGTVPCDSGISVPPRNSYGVRFPRPARSTSAGTGGSSARVSPARRCGSGKWPRVSNVGR